MPDNTPNDWNADEQFWADAWSDMEGQLDQKMPVKKRRRRMFPFWLLGVLIPLLAVVWLAFFVPAEQADGPIPTDSPAQINSLKPLPPKVSTEGDVPLVITDLELQKQSPEENRVVNKVARLNDRPAENESVTKKSPTITQLALIDSEIVNELATVFFTVDQTTTAPGSNTQDPRLPTKELIQTIALIPSGAKDIYPVVRMDHYNVPHGVAVGAQAHPTPAMDSDQATITPTKTKSIYQPLLYFGGSHGAQLPGIGYSGGVGLSRGMGKKARLTATLGYHVQQEAVRLGGSQDEDASELPTPGPNSSTDTILEIINALSGSFNNGGNAFLRTQNIRLGLGYARNLGDKFYLSAGVGVNLLTRADFSANGSNNNATLLGSSRQENAVNITSDDLFFDNSLAGGESLEDYFGLRRLRYDLNLMGGYRLNRHLSMEAGVKHYVSPILNTDNFSSDRWRGEVKLIYRF